MKKTFQTLIVVFLFFIAFSSETSIAQNNRIPLTELKSLPRVRKPYTKIPFTEIKNIPKGKAIIFIYRPSQMLGAAITYYVYANLEGVTELRIKNYYPYYANPGKYNIICTPSNYELGLICGELPLLVEEGKTYFLKFSVLKGLELFSYYDAINEIKKCSLFEEKDKNKKL